MEFNKIDFDKGVSLHIEGELGRYNTLPIDTLIDIAKSLQDLLRSIAISEITESSAIDLSLFNIELSNFEKGSAIPTFVFSRHANQNIIGNDIQKQKNIVNQNFEELIFITQSADFEQIKTKYPDAVRRNNIVDTLHKFTNSFKNSPTKIADIEQMPSESNSTIKPIYEIKKISEQTKEKLKIQIIAPQHEPKEEFKVGKIRETTSSLGKIKTKVIESFSKGISMSYAPSEIDFDGKKYILNFPLRCLFEKEENYFIIQSEMLDIIGTGETKEEAELSFKQEFDYIYNLYNETENEKLSKRLIKIKTILDNIVKQVI
jgi:hypothetical protein